MQFNNDIIQTKLSVDRCLNQLSHIQAMFLFCEPRNIGMDADLADGVLDMVTKARRDLRETHERLERFHQQHVESESKQVA